MSTVSPATPLPVIVRLTNPSSLYDRILQASGAPYTWPAGTAAAFSVRPLSSRTPVIANNSAIALTPPDLSGNNVRYDWTNTDLAQTGEGNFFGWWTYTTPGGSSIDTREFPIQITDHGPGVGTDTGAIVDGAAAYLPVSFTYLRNDTRFGDRFLQQRAELIKQKVLGYVVNVDAEVALPIVLLDFLSKRLALELITPAIDYWSRQVRTATSSGTSNEVTSYPDMIASLEKLRQTLAHQLADDWREVQLIVPGTPNRRVVPMPASSLEGIPNVTRDPQYTKPLVTTGWQWNWGGVLWPFP